jgi:2-keto-4-pentenoate hydratase
MQETAARHAAERLLAEHKANTQFGPFNRTQGPSTIADAYDIQHQFVGLLRAEHGDPIGYKVGLTSEPMQKFCGIDHPIAGVVLAKREHRSGATIRRADFGRLGLEFEIAVRIKSDVPANAAPMTAETIARYIGGVCAAIELVDDRSADYTGLDVLALLADNSWNGGIGAVGVGHELAGPRQRARQGDPGRHRDRRRPRPRYPGPSLPFGGVACRASRRGRRKPQGRANRDDRKRDEDHLPHRGRGLRISLDGIGEVSVIVR